MKRSEKGEKAMKPIYELTLDELSILCREGKEYQGLFVTGHRIEIIWTNIKEHIFDVKSAVKGSRGFSGKITIW